MDTRTKELAFLEQIIKEKKPDIKKTIGEISPLKLIQLLDERFLSGKIKEKKYNRLIGELTSYIASQREVLSRLAFDQYEHFVEMEDQQKIEFQNRVNKLVKDSKSDNKELAEAAQKKLDYEHARLLKKIVLQDKAEVEDARQLSMLVSNDIYSRETYNGAVLAIEHWIEIIVASLERGDFHTVKTICGKVGEALEDLIAGDESHFAKEIFEAWDKISAVLGNSFVLNYCMTGTAIPEMSGYQAEVARNKDAREFNVDLMEKTLAHISNLQMQNRLYVNALQMPIVGLTALSSKGPFAVTEKNFKSKMDALRQTKKETKKALRTIPHNQLQSKIPSYYLHMLQLRRYAAPKKEYKFEQLEWPALSNYINNKIGNWKTLNQFMEAYRRKNADRNAQLSFIENVISTKKYFLRADHSGYKDDPAINALVQQTDEYKEIVLFAEEVELLKDMREIYLRRVAILTLQNALNECVEWSKKVVYLNNVLKENKINVLGNDVVLDGAMRGLIEPILDTVVALERTETKRKAGLLEKIKAKAKVEEQASSSVQTDKPQIRYTKTQKQIKIPAEMDQTTLKLFKAKQAESSENKSNAGQSGPDTQSSAEESGPLQKLRKNSIFTFTFDTSGSASSFGSSMSAYAFSESPLPPSILIKSTPFSSAEDVASVIEEKEGKKEEEKELSSEGSTSTIGSSMSAYHFYSSESPPPSYSSYKTKSTSTSRPSPSSSSDDVTSSLEDDEGTKSSEEQQRQRSRSLQRTKRILLNEIFDHKEEVKSEVKDLPGTRSSVKKP